MSTQRVYMSPARPAQPSPVAAPKSAQPHAEIRPRRTSLRAGASSLWRRRKKKIDMIESRDDARDRWFLLLTKIAEDIGDRDVDRAIDAAIDADACALALLDLAGCAR
jgi:hypothetical protein